MNATHNIIINVVCNMVHGHNVNQAPRQVDKLPNIIILEYANMPWGCDPPVHVCAYIYLYSTQRWVNISVYTICCI
jgi:hypothetical protein